ncbi:hypothetical protein [Pelagicoccus albus]|uniref:Uncharacterized protein n=1 Tax=Pelagicoccus albus TaxID=415222 RepID=A0A7X1B8Z6_9BACT|nr:hypothetical protein [Pelagicoccus albus]MBC2607757.1 hypothetical protein [Pelagicoccus albus]
MSLAAPEPSQKPPSRKNKQGDRGWLSAGGYSKRQITVGVLGTFLGHIWLYLLFSSGFFEPGPIPESSDPYQEFSIELEAPEAQEPEPVYTKTNPDVPENEPDETNRFGARDQQAANEEAPEEIDPDNEPATESDDIIETDEFLTGSLVEPLVAPPPAPEAQEQETQEQPRPVQPPSTNQPLIQALDASGMPLKKEIPLFGSQEDAEDESGIAEHKYDKMEEAPTNVTDLFEGEEEEGEETEQTVEKSPQVSPSVAAQPTLEAIHTAEGVPSPRPRPQLPRVVTSPVRNSNLGVSNIGVVSADSRSSELGEYADRLFETISLYWNDLANRSAAELDKSVVKVRFRLGNDGAVLDIEILEGTTAKAAGIYLCREAIQRSSPFAPWPQSIVDLYGDYKDVFLTFNYF